MFDLENTIETLMFMFGEKRISHKHGTEFMAITKQNRKNILRHLISTAKQRGINKDYFKKSSVRTVIAEAFFPEFLTRTWDTNKRNSAYSVMFRELTEVLAEQFPESLAV